MALSQCFRAFRGCRHKGHHRGLPHLLSVKRQHRPTQMGVRWSRVVWAVLCLQRGPKTSDDFWPAPVSRGRSDICIYVQRDTAVLGDMLTICGHKQELFRSNMESVFSIVWGIHIFFTSVGGCFFLHTFSTNKKNLNSFCLVYYSQLKFELYLSGRSYKEKSLWRCKKLLSYMFMLVTD